MRGSYVLIALGIGWLVLLVTAKVNGHFKGLGIEIPPWARSFPYVYFYAVTAFFIAGWIPLVAWGLYLYERGR